jgi:phage portal protein BeeE
MSEDGLCYDNHDIEDLRKLSIAQLVYNWGEDLQCLREDIATLTAERDELLVKLEATQSADTVQVSRTEMAFLVLLMTKSSGTREFWISCLNDWLEQEQDK